MDAKPLRMAHASFVIAGRFNTRAFIVRRAPFQSGGSHAKSPEQRGWDDLCVRIDIQQFDWRKGFGTTRLMSYGGIRAQVRYHKMDFLCASVMRNPTTKE